ncbi:MAG: hypothetical protein ACPG7F_11690 [Aggregatilineales bacterium]
MSNILILNILMVALALWMGCYLLARNFSKPGMRYAGMGLLAYAMGLLLLTFFDDIPAVLSINVLLIPSLCWIAAVYRLLPGKSRDGLPRRPLLLIVIATIFFGLGGSLILLPQDFIPQNLLLPAIGMDLLILGYAIAALDAHDEGEALFRDALRSFVAAFAGVVIFGGQILMVITIEGVSPGLLFLLVTVTVGMIVLQVFAPVWRNLLDNLIFADASQLQVSRADLLAAADALPRVNASLDIVTMDDKEFARLTRRALGHMNHPDKLLTSPLMQLPLIDTRLLASQRPHSLERAAELKTLLIESIERLKPRTDDTGTSEAWRYYNALYYPYVRGIKPYSRRLILSEYSAEDREILEWFRAQVPERTLYNWQNKAAELIAQDLREQMHSRER